MHNLNAYDSLDRDEAAAYWVMIMTGPDVPAHRERLFDTWISADPENAMAYADCLASYDSAPVQEAASQSRTGRRLPVFGLWSGAVAASLALVIIGGSLWSGRHPAPSVAEPGYNQTLSTTAGQTLTARLPDGSQVALNGNTELSVHFAGHDRRVALKRGEAYFDIAHDATRPFVVDTANAHVRVLGTAFNIDRLSSTQAEVAVYRGRVRVEAPAGQRDLGVGERVVTDDTLTPVRFEATDTPDWQDGWFEADNITLGRLVAEADRFSPLPVRIDTPDLAARRVSGRFKVSDTDLVLKGLKQVYGIHIRRDKNVIVLTK